jgi:dipeptidyl aminopeptidase/acylaminoacyl peptidase
MAKLFLPLALFGALTSLCAQKVPITHEDVWTMKRVGAPAVSPDGKWAVVSVTEPSYDADKQVSDLWIVPVDRGAKPRRLTFTKAPESGVAFSPDSKAIAFSAKREGDEASQIYILRLDGGEAERLTSLSTAAYSPKWRPDGKALLFQSMVYPGAADDEANKREAAERKARKYKTRVYETFPFQYWDRWLDDLRPHILVQEIGGKPRDVLAGTKLVAGKGFDANPGLSSEGDLDPVWSPDGRSIVFVATTERDAAAYAATSNHLYVVPADGGEPRALTSGKAGYASPRFRPDGRALYATFTRLEDSDLYTATRLAMLTWNSSEAPVLLTSKWDRSVDAYAFSPDSRTVFITSEDRGLDRIFRMPANGGEVRPAFEMKEGGYSGVVIPERAPRTVLVAHEFLTDFNGEKLATLDLPAPLHHWFTDSTGKRIHSLIVLPPAFDRAKKYPVVVFPHGGPHNMTKDQWFLRWNYHLLTSPGYVLIMTNYTGSTGFGEEFAAAIHKDILRGPGREILEAVDAAAREFPFMDTGRMAGIGASYGGYLMAWFEGNTDRFKCLVNHAGLVDNVGFYMATDGAYYWERRNGGPIWETKGAWLDQNPMRYAPNFKTPMLVTHGERDFRVPVSQGYGMFKLLQRQRVPARFVVFPDENHWIANGHNARQHMTEVLGWLAKYLPPAT